VYRFLCALLEFSQPRLFQPWFFGQFQLSLPAQRSGSSPFRSWSRNAKASLLGKHGPFSLAHPVHAKMRECLCVPSRRSPFSPARTPRTPRRAPFPSEHRLTMDPSKPVRLPLLWKWMAAFSRLAMDGWPCRCGRPGDGETQCPKVYSNGRPSSLVFSSHEVDSPRLRLARGAVRCHGDRPFSPAQPWRAKTRLFPRAMARRNV
jgi:hypothetical protein